jgi:hypothetical protein
MVAQIEEAGFAGVTARSLIPGESFYAFIGTNPGGQRLQCGLFSGFNCDG